MNIFSMLLVALAIIISTVYLLKKLTKRVKFFWQLEKLPGPRAFPLVGSTYELLTVPRNSLLDLIRNIYNQYPPIFRTWTGPYPAVHIHKAEHVKIILNNSKHLEKSFAYKFLLPWLGTGLLTSKGVKWHSHRKMITPTFHFMVLNDFIEVFSEKSKILMEKLMLQANGKSFDIFPYITRCALDIICDTAMGTHVRAQEDIDSEYVKAVSDISELTLRRTLSPWLHPNFLFYSTWRGRRYKDCLNILHGFTRKVIQERKSAMNSVTPKTRNSHDGEYLTGKKSRTALLDHLLEMSQNNDGLSDEEIREEVDTFMYEGHDTTAASMTWVLYMLGHYPEIQEKVYAELREIFQDSERSPSMKDIHKMKYLEQVIKETLRLYPSVPFIQRTTSEDVCIDGYEIPAGCTITLGIYFTHRDVRFFPNAEKFDPDNFLPERIQSRHPYAYIPFSAGPRNCIGQKFALLEEKTILSSILRKFKVRSLEKREDIKVLAELILKPDQGVKVTLTLRE